MMKHRIFAGVIVESSDRLLLVRRAKADVYDFWVAPGGGVQGAESLIVAARREAREETGLEVEPVKLAYIEELIDRIAIAYCGFALLAAACTRARQIFAPNAHGSGRFR